MKGKIVNPKKIHFQSTLSGDLSGLYDWISQPHYLGQWLADTVSKTSKGFDIKIKFPLHTIENSATIIKQEPPRIFEFMWNSEYVLDTSVVTFELTEREDKILLDITEVGDFDKSRWSNPQEIHLDLWQKALQRLVSRFNQ